MTTSSGSSFPAVDLMQQGAPTPCRISDFAQQARTPPDLSRQNLAMGWLMFEDASDIYGDDLPVSSIAKKTQVFVKHLHGTLSLQVDLTKDVEVLKEVVEKRLQRNVSDEYFAYYLKELEPRNSLLSYGIKRDSTISLTPRLRGGRRRLKTLLRFFLKHKEELVKLVELPDGSDSVELTYMGCKFLASWLCCFLRAFASGRSWGGSFDLVSFLVPRQSVHIFKTPSKELNSRNLHMDCTTFTRFVRVMFVLNNQHPPYLLHLLSMLDNLTMEDLSADMLFALATHISLMPSLNRVCLVYLIKRRYDGWRLSERRRFRNHVSMCQLHQIWLLNLRFVPLFGDVLVETLRRSAVSHNDWHQLFVTIRNYNTHGPEYCWRGNVQWFDYSNNGMELMVPKYTADFLAQMLDVLIQRKFDIKDELMACSVSCCARKIWKRRFRENSDRRSSSTIDSERSVKTNKRRHAESYDRRGSKKHKKF
ncbi:hypothetical protein GQ55_8G052800 [Panicum hallii var. hallii]|uniref:Ubiquitin-like domain-containing protein n=1 Tax=Panicum hallii var. hallii TaxID=1504633 RepID=A0A2T7CKZ2_9POAL|nr:hypothetical protein GQ55_8G052800 [Panicum hallii var. hallii]